jgi:hypothetical protein
MDITDINNLIYAAATIMTLTLEDPSKRIKNRRNKKFWKIRMQKQISGWRKELSIIGELEQALIMESLTGKRGRFLKKYRVTNAREFTRLTETLKQKVQAKAQRIRRCEKREAQYSQNKMVKEDTKIFTETWA